MSTFIFHTSGNGSTDYSLSVHGYRFDSGSGYQRTVVSTCPPKPRRQGGLIPLCGVGAKYISPTQLGGVVLFTRNAVEFAKYMKPIAALSLSYSQKVLHES